MISPQSEVRGDVGGIHRPALFVGSSSEGLEFARAARGLLNHDAEVTLWNEGFFRLGDTFIETLLNGLPGFDFALLVVTPDDFVRTRDVEVFGPRDNVLFELGLFMGHLGRSRTFLLHQAGAVKLPTDLSGMTAATYDWPRDDQNHQGAVAAACDMIRRAIRELGVTKAKAEIRYQQLEETQRKQQERQQAIQDLLSEIFPLLLPANVLQHLENLSKAENKAHVAEYTGSDPLRQELRQLRYMGLIEVASPKHKFIGDIPNGKFALAEYVRLTPQGRHWVDLAPQVPQVSAIAQYQRSDLSE
jgi:hypothetical protein